MPDIFGLKQAGRATVGGRFYATPTERVEAGAIYVPNESSPLFGIAEYPVEAGTLGAFTTEGTFVFDKPENWSDSLGRKVFCRPSTGEIVNQDQKGDVLIGFQIFANIPDSKLGVVLTQGEISVVILVTSTADSGSGSLRQAIADAQDGDVILFDPIVFPVGETTSILLSSQITINKQLTIDAIATATIPGATTTPRVAIDAQNNSRCLYLQAAAGGTLRGLLFCNASNSSNGGAVYCAATSPVTFTQCRFSDSTGNTGGGLSTTVAANLTFDRCGFSGNTANSNGGAVYGSSTATLTFDDCTFSGNTASNGGAVSIANSVQAALNNCILTNNTSQNFGSAVRLDASSGGAIINCEIYGNTSVNYGTSNDVSAGGTSVVSVTASRINGVGFGAQVVFHIDAGVTTIGALSLNKAGDSASTVTISDGAALAVTTAATVPSGVTFTSAGRAYLATATGLDFSAATLNNVVACTYGAGLESFAIDEVGATWTAQDLTVPILIEQRGSDATWTTLSSVATGGTYSDSFDVGTTARAFDGVRFLTASIDAYWLVNASVAANANGGGGTGSASPSWAVENKTITPNVEG